MKNIVIVIDPWQRWLISRILFFTSSKYWMFRSIKKLVASDKNIDTVIFASYDTFPVDNLYLTWNPQKTTMWITEEQDMENLLLQHNIEKIYMCGGAWDICVRNRPLGYLNLKRLIDKLKLDTRILVKADCVVNDDHSYFVPTDNLEWKQTEDKDIYIYQPKKDTQD